MIQKQNGIDRLLFFYVAIENNYNYFLSLSISYSLSLSSPLFLSFSLPLFLSFSFSFFLLPLSFSFLFLSFYISFLKKKNMKKLRKGFSLYISTTRAKPAKYHSIQLLPFLLLQKIKNLQTK